MLIDRIEQADKRQETTQTIVARLRHDLDLARADLAREQLKAETLGRTTTADVATGDLAVPLHDLVYQLVGYVPTSDNAKEALAAAEFAGASMAPPDHPDLKEEDQKSIQSARDHLATAVRECERRRKSAAPGG